MKKMCTGFCPRQATCLPVPLVAHVLTQILKPTYKLNITSYPQHNFRNGHSVSYLQEEYYLFRVCPFSFFFTRDMWSEQSTSR